MNYIGSKHRLSDFIKTTVKEVCGDDLSQKTFCDLFAGTGSVGRNFKPIVKSVIANDLEYYSYVLNRNYIGNHKELSPERYFQELNDLEGASGFIYTNYGEGGGSDRLYFSKENAQKIDAIRQKIESWKQTGTISEDIYFLLLASLIESADKIANTASVYGAFLKKIKKMASVLIHVEPASFDKTPNSHTVFHEDGNTLVKKIEGDILYLDPPYNVRQYGSNYHILNTIAKYDTFVPRGKTGLRNYNRSAYCSSVKVVAAFEELIKNAQFKHIFLSYNNEGLMPPDIVRQVMQRYGKYDLATIDYKRFKADMNRKHKAKRTTEYLHILEK
ncbi:restriction endonuclease subunit M [Dokdonia pacifica]|uniref:site-specific DNA-methyltransferase (adenine-specific) n=1 Tax=Dokdonia pacifica TaxID=1627892 RepID=A0A238WGN6_9FLAO|nr:DNA adenine methylase [Dokdonia pacifica]GGG21053.1 restriction endonuclease subunit M [Dokdonia pacifica]SNR45735.1 adenine-specific DNA-methyltransferase [Dokdonia pacifica]